MSQFNVKLIKGKIDTQTHIYIYSNRDVFEMQRCTLGKSLLKSHKNINWLSFVDGLQLALFSLLGFPEFFNFCSSCVCYGFYSHITVFFVFVNCFAFFFKYFLDPVLALLPSSSQPPPPPAPPYTTGNLLTSGPR